jgi:hypothetical protein
LERRVQSAFRDRDKQHSVVHFRPGRTVGESKSPRSVTPGSRAGAIRKTSESLAHRKGRAIRAETKTLANALCDKAGIPVDTLAELNERIKELRDAFRAE